MKITHHIENDVNKTFYCGKCRGAKWEKDNNGKRITKYCEIYNRYLEPYSRDCVVKCNECLLAIARELRKE